MPTQVVRKIIRKHNGTLVIVQNITFGAFIFNIGAK